MRTVLYKGRPWLVELARWPESAPGRVDSVWREVVDKSGMSPPDDEVWLRLATSAFGTRPVIVANAVVLVDGGDGEPFLNDLTEAHKLDRLGVEGLSEVRAGYLQWFFLLIGVPREDWGERTWSRKTRQKLVDRVREARPEVPELLLGQDQFELYRVVGERLPFLWPTEAFLTWAMETSSLSS